MRKVSREEAGLIELGRRLPDSALVTFQLCRTRLQSLALEARYGSLTNDGRIERQMTLEQLDGLSMENLGISFIDLCERIMVWATASCRGATLGTTVQPDLMVTFRLEGVDESVTVRPGGVNAYLEEVAPPVVVPVPPVAPPKPTAPDIFASLEIRLLPRQESGYPVDLVLTGANLTDPQRYQRGYLASDVAAWQSAGDWEADGKRLFAALTDDRAVMRAWAQAAGQASRRRIQLWIDEAAPELHTLPWELLYDDVLLSANADTPFSRMMPAATPWGEMVTSLPLRMLAAVANPQDLAEKGLASLPASEAELLTQFNGEKLHFDVLPPPVTLERLEARLRDGYHGLHIIAHGEYSRRNERAALWLEDAQGNGQIVQDKDMGDMLRRLGQAQRPRLVFLAACQSAVRSGGNAFVGLGPTLGRAGAPVVVAMQDNVSLNAARTLSCAFYERLVASDGIVDLALNEARGTLDTQNSPEAAVPVLFMRLRDGRLWQ